MARILFLLLSSCVSLSALGQQVDCSAGAGLPASLERYPSGAPDIYAAKNSGSIGPTLVLKDAQGRALRDAQLEMALPDSPEELVFRDGLGYELLSPKRVRVGALADCSIGLPNVIAGPQTGTFTATVRVAPAETEFDLPIHVIDTDAYVARTFPDDPRLLPTSVIAADAAIATGSVPGASAEWSDGQGQFGPLAGVPITFTAPATAPTLEFANGLHAITVPSNTWGVASAPARAVGGTGSIVVRAIYPDGSVAFVQRYVALAPPEVRLGSGISLEYGSTQRLEGRARYVGFACDLDPVNFLAVDARVTSEGVALVTGGVSYSTAERVCPGDVIELPFGYSIAGLPFGDWKVTAEVTDRNGTLAPARAEIPVSIVPAATLVTANGHGWVRVGSSDPGYSQATGKCAVVTARSLDTSSAGFPPTRPDTAELRYGAVQLELGNCSWASTADFGVQLPPPPIAQRVLLQVDEDLPVGTVVFAYGPTRDRASPHWYELRTAISGRFAQFDVTDGSFGDDSLVGDGVIRPLVAVGVPRHAAVPGSLQDLWWVGPAENGWGMSLTQHDDRLFAGLFIYDAQGDPRWVVMSAGAWDAARAAFTGALYRPKGTPLAQGIAAGIRVGVPVGSLRISPIDHDNLRIDYTLDGITATKELHRQAFGPEHPFPLTRFDDLWWGGVNENGWGFALTQQYRTFFGVLYTYDANGDPIWFVAPAGVIGPPDSMGSASLTSPIYRTHGSPWLGTAYDPSRLMVTEVGALRMTVRDGWVDAALAGSILGWRAFSYPVTRQPF